MKKTARHNARRPAGVLVGLLAMCAVLTFPARAQPASAAPGKPAESGESGELGGRLFFTPERRQQLDRQRQLKLPEKAEVAADPTLTINGVVTRSSGKRTVWINGVAQNDNEQPGAAVTTSRQSPGQIIVRPADAPAASAAVGDTVDRNSGRASGLLGGGRIIRHPAGAN